MKRHSSRICSLLAIAVLALISFADVTAHEAIGAGDAAPKIEVVENAWKKRDLTVKACNIKVTIQRTIPGSGVKPRATGDLFSDPEPKEDLVSTIKGEYFFDGKKTGMACETNRLLDSQNPDNAVSQYFRTTFDGRENRDLTIQDGLKLGMIEISKVASGKLLANVDFMALDLWLRPQQFLEHVGRSTRNMRLGSKHPEVEGIKCWRVLISHQQTKRWSAALDVDPNRGCVPILFQTWLDGSPQMYLLVRYDTQQDQPGVRDWSYMHYHMKREEVLLSDIRLGNVQSCKINSPIDRDQFTLAFPIGTYVVQTKGGDRTHFIQAEEGLRPIKSSEFGKLQLNEDAI